MPNISVRDTSGVVHQMATAEIGSSEQAKQVASTTENRFFSSFADFNTTVDWEVEQTGAGQTIVGVLGGDAAGATPYLSITAGTTAGAKTVILSRAIFEGSTELRFGLSASQRIANSLFRIGFVECNANGVLKTSGDAPEVLDTRNALLLSFSGTNQANVQMICRSSGSALESTTTSFTSFTTAATGTTPNFIIDNHMSLSLERDRVSARRIALNGQNNAGVQVVRDSVLPDPNKLYRLAVIVENGSTAPVSSTTWRLHLVNVLDSARFEVAARHGGSDDQLRAFPTRVLSLPAVAADLPTPNVYGLEANLATTNATLVKNSAATIFSIVASNISAATVFLKLYQKSTAPVVGTDTPFLTIPLPANSLINHNFGALGLRWPVGIGFGLTTAIGDGNSAAPPANDVKLHINYL